VQSINWRVQLKRKSFYCIGNWKWHSF